MARIDTLTNFLTDIADAVREKSGNTDKISASLLDTEIRNLPVGGASKYAPRFISFYNYTGTELDDEVRLKVSNKKNKRKSANDFDFAGSFQGKKMYLVSFKPKHCM